MVPPIQKDTIQIEGRKITLLRLGKAAAPNLRKIANTMAKIWREDVSKKPTGPNVYGCICGLAEDLPAGWQVEIFKHALKDWDGFCACAKLEIEIANYSAEREYDVFTPDALTDHTLATARRFPGEHLFLRYYRFPSITFLRKFHHVATDIWISDRQAKALGYPARVL